MAFVVHRSAALLLIGVVATACGSDSQATPTGNNQPSQPSQPSTDTVSLRTLANGKGRLIGSAVDRGFRYPGSDGVTFRTALARDFSVLTPENDMKHERIHPARDVYRFEPADSLATFADANGMKVRGHTLIWHQQLASWLTSGTWTTDEAKALLVDHVTKVVSHYRGRVIEWDVVNEALGDNGSLRSSFWFDHIGRDYVELAFRTAHDADPNVALFYDDYNIEGINPKSDSLFALVRDFQSRGVPINGIGLESHFQLGGVPGTLGANIARFAALGLKVHITELDVRMPLPSTATQLQTQAQNYRDVFSTCLQYLACDVVVMWGFTDKESWIPSAFPGWGAALILDAAYQAKPAYTSLHDLLK
ncbi:MAG TPA: endo-1,4-beta-xylanase [Gemmatimonadaceae bacterium]|nr:endo-1,4-beta-xylanase [Gemmatimonadaceae bacterium]